MNQRKCNICIELCYFSVYRIINVPTVSRLFCQLPQSCETTRQMSVQLTPTRDERRFCSSITSNCQVSPTPLIQLGLKFQSVINWRSVQPREKWTGPFRPSWYIGTAALRKVFSQIFQWPYLTPRPPTATPTVTACAQCIEKYS